MEHLITIYHDEQASILLEIFFYFISLLLHAHRDLYIFVTTCVCILYYKFKGSSVYSILPSLVLLGRSADALEII